jgi:hypothetical protein
MRRHVVLSLLVFVCLAASVRAAEPFVVLVDEERSLLLIPEGTVVPRGVEFTLSTRAGEPRFRFEGDAVAEEGAGPRRFVYAYTDPERFVEARRRIVEAEARFPDPPAELIFDGERKPVETAAGVGRFRVASNVADFDQTYYYYFWDGSYHAIRKVIQNVANNGVSFKAYGYVYAEAGDWDTKVMVNNTTTGGTTYWNQSKTCNYYNTAATCTPLVYIYSTYPYSPFTATVTSQGALTRFLYPPCDLPCKSNSSSTLSVSFP